ncbi:hypothetical protein Dimus_013290, partial [Dionaea muscipula]
MPSSGEPPMAELRRTFHANAELRGKAIRPFMGAWDRAHHPGEHKAADPRNAELKDGRLLSSGSALPHEHANYSPGSSTRVAKLRPNGRAFEKAELGCTWSKYSRRSQPHAEQEAIAELTSIWNNTTVAVADHEEEGRGEYTPWPSLSSAKLLISDEQLRVGLLSSSQDRRQP